MGSEVSHLKPGFSGHTLGKTITQADVNLFEQLVERKAPQTGCGLAIVPEFLVTMTSVGLINRLGFLEGNLVAVMDNDWHYQKKVKINDTLTVVYKVSDVTPNKKGDKNAITFVMETLDQENELVATGKWKVMMKQ